MHPILFRLGPITVRSYGVLVAAAFFIGFFLLYKEARRKNFYPEKISDMALLLVIAGVIGARALHVLVNWDYYGRNIFDTVLVWRGGLAIHGGILFGVIAGSIFAAKNKMPILETADMVVPYLALGQSIGRIGCFLNGCCFGRDGHPTQIYATLALLAIFVILRLAGRSNPPAGALCGLYLVLYGAERFFIDFLRADLPAGIFGLTLSQVISVAVFVAGVALLGKRWMR